MHIFCGILKEALFTPAPSSKPIPPPKPIPPLKPIPSPEPIPPFEPFPAPKPIAVSEPIMWTNPKLKKKIPVRTLGSANKMESASSREFQQRSLPSDNQNFWAVLGPLSSSLIYSLMSVMMHYLN
jgi:hypothetical protein